ncbi:hypothetical protein [Halorientalis regularis]|uniref:hypothetical protein n=1 Tax=Halorientalis regularis TaxID=660518 RepID=UPI000B874615|nr:hypothetical protein [Halorientalis regularis]
MTATADDGDAIASGPDPVIRFRYVRNLTDIPAADPDVAQMPPYPEVSPTTVTDHGNGTVTVELTTWSRVNGVLTNWTVRVADGGDVARALGVAQATRVGDCRLVWEGTPTPARGDEYISLGRAELSVETGQAG